jgi:hypothetical protein
LSPVVYQNWDRPVAELRRPQLEGICYLS